MSFYKNNGDIFKIFNFNSSYCNSFIHKNIFITVKIIIDISYMSMESMGMLFPPNCVTSTIGKLNAEVSASFHEN